MMSIAVGAAKAKALSGGGGVRLLARDSDK